MRLTAVTALTALSLSTAADAQVIAKLVMPGGSVGKEKMFELARPQSRANQGPVLTSPLLSKPRVCLVLGGGGTRGAAHVGVLRVLRDAGVPIDCIAGTSIGAIVGGLYLGGVPLDTLENQVRNNSVMRSFMNVPLKMRVFTTPIHLLPRLVGIRSLDGLYSGTKFRKYLEKQLPDPEQNIEDLKTPFCAVSLSLIDGQLHSFTRGNLVRAMQASSALPELRRPVVIDNNLYVDGGIFSNVPVEQARSVLGASFIIAVDIDERFNDVQIDHFKKLGSVGSRLVTLELVHNDWPELSKADIVIHPNVDGIGLISRKKSDSNAAFEAGIAATREALPSIVEALKARGVEVGSVLVSH
ncbi:MAG: patatin-like phospholipase family protein [Cyanobacteria bacterium REEB67]|nr:patatin-like phospholipase family protein [Cyanobacteria bacterium REEB67]